MCPGCFTDVSLLSLGCFTDSNKEIKRNQKQKQIEIDIYIIIIIYFTWNRFWPAPKDVTYISITRIFLEFEIDSGKRL